MCWKRTPIELEKMSLHGYFWNYFRSFVSVKGIEVDKAKIEVISKLPQPKIVRDVQSFLGHAWFYRKLIKNFSAISKPLYNLLLKDAPIEWTDDCQKSFKKKIYLLTFEPIMQSPD